MTYKEKVEKIIKAKPKNEFFLKGYTSLGYLEYIITDELLLTTSYNGIFYFTYKLVEVTMKQEDVNYLKNLITNHDSAIENEILKGLLDMEI